VYGDFSATLYTDHCDVQDYYEQFNIMDMEKTREMQDTVIDSLF
jgi:hypothetical protein